MSSVRTRANKTHFDRNSRRIPWAEAGSKQENPNLFKINQFNRQNIIKLIN